MHKIKKEVLGKRKRNHENNNRGAKIAAVLLDTKTVHHEEALKDENLQWTVKNKLLSAD